MKLYIFTTQGLIVLDAPEGYDNPAVFRGLVVAMRSDQYFAWVNPPMYIPERCITLMTVVKDGEEPTFKMPHMDEITPKGRPN